MAAGGKSAVWTVMMACCLVAVSSYKSVIIVHGVMDQVKDFDLMVNFITTAHPGTNVTVIDAYDGRSSLTNNIWKQVDDFAQKMSVVMRQNSPGGVHVLCFSQGGVICRGVLSVLADHNVNNLISLSCPMMGQFGDTSYLKYFFPKFTRDNLYRVLYTKRWQQDFAVANYWNDPKHQDLYREFSTFLAVVNNDTFNSKSQEFKKNFLRTKKLIMIGGPDDGVITPWQSSQFGFYDSTLHVLPMQKQRVYREDSFGLRTMDERGGVHTCTASGVKHTKWHYNETVFTNCIQPWLD